MNSWTWIYIAVFCGGASLALFLTPVFAMIARKTGFLDVPASNHKKHQNATPLLGGAAMFTAWILAIIGGMLGATQIVATDIDPVAVETAKINIQKNGYSDICDVRCGDLLDCVGEETFDVITANIIVDVLLILLKDVKQCLNPDGILILSGILEERVNEILDAATENGFSLVEKTVDNDWCGLAFRIA